MRFLKLGVACTLILCLFLFSSFACSAVSVPSGYEIFTPDVASCYAYSVASDRTETYIPEAPFVNITSSGSYEFAYTINDMNLSALKYEISFPLPTDLDLKLYNYYFVMDSGTVDLLKPSYGTLTYYDENSRPHYVRATRKDNSLYWNLKCVKIQTAVYFEFYFDVVNGHQGERAAFMISTSYSKDPKSDPSEAAYDKPDDSAIKDYSEGTDTSALTNESSKVNKQLEDNTNNMISTYGGALKAFSKAVEYVVDIPKINPLIYFSLGIAVIPIIAGMTINGLKARDRNQAAARRRSGRR